MPASWPGGVAAGQTIEAAHHNGLRDNVPRKAVSLTGQNFYTQGRLPFADASGFLAEDSGLSWDNTNKRLVVGAAGGTLPTWNKFTIGEAALTDADTSEDEALFTALQHQKVHAITIKHSAAFTGGGLSSMTISIGTAASPTYYVAAYNIFQAVGDLVFLDENIFGSVTMAAAGHPVIARFTSGGGNVADATAGSVDVWIQTSLIQ